MTRWTHLETAEGVRRFLEKESNWGRWGDDDRLGTANLVTPGKRVEACAMVRQGTTVSLARPIDKDPAPGNPRPAERYWVTRERGDGAGSVSDYLGLYFHGRTTTHLDALCHAYGDRGMWNGRAPGDEIGADGAKTLGIENLSGGLITRGILLDVPSFRNTPYVDMDRPVTGDELEAIADHAGLAPRPGDAIVVHSGRERYSSDRGPWGANRRPAPPPARGEPYRPGLHPSCLGPLRSWDASLLVWDMMDVEPDPLGLPWGVHAALHALGLPLVDNAYLGGLAAHCAATSTYEFMLVVAPLHLPGGTGSPVNPLAVF